MSAASVTVIGVGAVGGLVAAHLCQAPGNAVSLAVRTAFDRLILERDDTLFEAQPRIMTDPEQAEPTDWILLATKAYDSEAASTWFEACSNAETRLAVIQNGVDHVDRLSRWYPRERILPVMIDCPVERVEPGHIRQRGPAVLKFPANEHGRSFAALFAGTDFSCEAVEDFVSVAWWKLCLNAAGVVNALALKPSGIAHDPHAAGLMRRIVEEAAAVGRAEGAQLDKGIADEVISIYRNHPADSVNSLHADRLAGRPMEIDLRNGIVVDLGTRHGIPTPCNEMAVALLKVNGPNSGTEVLK